MNTILETKRINFRKISTNDYEHLCKILKDPKIMYAWEHGFSDNEVKEWMEKNFERYEKDGFSYYAALEKDTNNFLGVMGPLIENINDEKFVGVAYILDKKYWRKGYAVEGVGAWIKYIFKNLKKKSVIAQIRPENISSRRVAEKLGMEIVGKYTKVYQEKELIHLIYQINKSRK